MHTNTYLGQRVYIKQIKKYYTYIFSQMQGAGKSPGTERKKTTCRSMPSL